MTQSNNRTAEMTADQTLIDGINAVLAKTASLTVGSQVLAPADIVKILQARIDASKAVAPAKASFTAAVKAARDERAQTAAFVRTFRRLLQMMFSTSPDTLAAFGLTAPKVGKKSAEVKATAAAKSKVTRQARGEVSKKAPKAPVP